MRSLARVLRSFAGLLLLFAGLTGAARAADLSHAVILVASEKLAGSVYEQTVMLAAPLPQGGHFGVVINRPSGVKLESLFPEQASTRKVVDPVYMGGPMLPTVLVALARKAPKDSGEFVAVMPGLVAAMNGQSVDRVIEETPNDARYFLGLTIWPPDALDAQINSGAWQVRPADVDTAMPSNPQGLWKALLGTEI